ncbi:MAG: sulfotransferase domain-containing protein [Actinomycetota bacterium]|nr:sulfotransferase domain-containing protein [Actinomycetota bacterium]
MRTSSVYDVDGVAVRLGADLIGSRKRPAAVEALREAQEVHFVKTHRPRDGQVDEVDKAICLVRDGRDALVSWARQVSEKDGRRYEDELRAMIIRPDERGAGQWGRNVLSWLQPQVPQRAVLRYEDLARDPGAAVDQVMTALLPELRPPGNAAVPSFTELQRVDARFFRRGFTGTYRDELPGELHQFFWSQPENVAAMKLLGWEQPPADRGSRLSAM